MATLFPESHRALGFQLTTAQRNQLVPILGNGKTTRSLLNVAEAARSNSSLARCYHSEVKP